MNPNLYFHIGYVKGLLGRSGKARSSAELIGWIDGFATRMTATYHSFPQLPPKGGFSP